MPQISILVPTFEPDPAHLRAALDALFRQHSQDWHVLVHDDASRTDVESIIAPYRASDRFTYIRSESRLGIAGNWNASLAHAKSPFVQYLFQDDVWHEQYLERALKAMTEGVGMVVTAHKYQIEGTMRFEKDTNAWYRDVERVRSHWLANKQNGTELLSKWLEQGLHPNVIGEPSFVMCRREVMEAAGKFDASLPQGLDLDMWTRILPLTQVAYVKEDGGVFRVHSKGASAMNKEAGAGLLDRLTILHKLTRHSDGTIKKEARAAFAKSLHGMFHRAGKRKEQGAKLPMSEFLRFGVLAIKHPILTLRGVLP